MVPSDRLQVALPDERVPGLRAVVFLPPVVVPPVGPQRAWPDVQRSPQHFASGEFTELYLVRCFRGIGRQRRAPRA
eukprot:8739987-Lingulodinium_polyedra.AAC.1